MALTLATLRRKFVEESGRYDLVTDYHGEDYTDNGANYFLQAGQRLLDLFQENQYTTAEYKKDLTAGDILLRIPYLRVVENVYIYDPSTLETYALTRVTLEETKAKYQEDFADIDRGAPEYYCPEVFNLAPSQNLYDTVSALETAVSDGIDFSEDYANILADNTFQNRGILLLPPSDGVYTVGVIGQFFSKLTEDNDYTYWTQNFPEVSVLAANWALEAHYRNTSGMNDWLNAINLYLGGIDKDMVRSEIAYAGNQMKG